jgi:rhodanese-related sulfurtransferase
VRTAEEFALDGLTGAQNTPGGQMIQATDQFVGVRNARIVLYDSDGVRAITVASWLKQMGHDVAVLRDGVKSQVSLPKIEIDYCLGSVPMSTAELLEIHRNNSAMIVDIRNSMKYREAHLPNALWAIRSRLQDVVQGAQKSVVLISDDPALTYCALLELKRHHLSVQVYQSEGSQFPKEFEAVSSETQPPDSDCIDFLFFVHDRHDGNKDAARRYLEWETGLIAQLDNDEMNLFSIQ